jgi:hypothetical protein
MLPSPYLLFCGQLIQFHIMAPQDLNKRIEVFKAVFASGGGGVDQADVNSFAHHLEEAGGDIDEALSTSQKPLPSKMAADTSAAGASDMLRFINDLAHVTGNNAPLVVAMRKEQPERTDLRKVALGFGIQDLKRLARVSAESSSGGPEQPLPLAMARDDDSAATEIAVSVRRRLFDAVPTAVVQRMLIDSEIKLRPETQSPV